MNKLVKYSNLFPTAIPSVFNDVIEKMFTDLDFYDPECGGWKLTKGFPKGDVFVENDKAVIELALAGYDQSQLAVSIDGNKVVVSAKKDNGEQEPQKVRMLARRSFAEEFYFNDEFDLNSTEASYKNGLLKIVVPKFAPEPKVIKQIEIK